MGSIPASDALRVLGNLVAPVAVIHSLRHGSSNLSARTLEDSAHGCEAVLNAVPGLPEGSIPLSSTPWSIAPLMWGTDCNPVEGGFDSHMGFRPISSTVERQSSKLDTSGQHRHRVPYRISSVWIERRPTKSCVGSSNLPCGTHSPLAQSVELGAVNACD